MCDRRGAAVVLVSRGRVEEKKGRRGGNEYDMNESARIHFVPGLFFIACSASRSSSWRGIAGQVELRFVKRHRADEMNSVFTQTSLRQDQVLLSTQTSIWCPTRRGFWVSLVRARCSVFAFLLAPLADVPVVDSGCGDFHRLLFFVSAAFHVRTS